MALVFPQFNDIKDTRVGFFMAHPGDEGYNGSAIVGLLSDANDLESMFPIDTIYVNKGEQHYFYYDLDKYSSIALAAVLPAPISPLSKRTSPLTSVFA